MGFPSFDIVKVFQGIVIEMLFFFFQAEDGIRDLTVTGVQTCALPISAPPGGKWDDRHRNSARGQSRGQRPARGADDEQVETRGRETENEVVQAVFTEIGRASCRERV